MSSWRDWFAFGRRRQWFEFHDLGWLPESIHDDLLYTDVWLGGLFRVKDAYAGLLARLIEQCKVETVIDLCSGAGGILPALHSELKDRRHLDFKLVLTDLIPATAEVRARIEAQNPSIRYDPRPIDAGSLPAEWTGMRTVFFGMHHLRPDGARSVLRDAYEKKQPILIAEIHENNLLQCMGGLFTFFIAWWALTFRRPFSLARFFRATLFPIVPLMHCFDAVSSVRRTYTDRDLERMTQDLSTGYRWEIGRTQVPHLLTPGPYLLGYPEPAPALDRREAEVTSGG